MLLCVFVCLPEAPVKRDLLVKKDIIKASFWAVLRHYGNIWHLNTPANELTKVGVIELPGDRERVRTANVLYERFILGRKV